MKIKTILKTAELEHLARIEREGDGIAIVMRMPRKKPIADRLYGIYWMIKWAVYNRKEDRKQRKIKRKAWMI